MGGLVLLAPLDLARRAQVAELAVVAALAATGVVEPGDGRRAQRAGSESERPKVSGMSAYVATQNGRSLGAGMLGFGDQHPCVAQRGGCFRTVGSFRRRIAQRPPLRFDYTACRL